jgi:hypothetical protein
MRISALAPFMFAGLMAVAGVAAAVSPAQAQPANLSDSDYLQAAHCIGVAEGLGADGKPLSKWMDSESFNHPSYIVDQANQSRDSAARSARSANPDVKARLEAQQTGVCRAYVN